MSVRVALNAIAIDAGTQIRASINEDVVADYAEHMTAGAQFPPIVLFHDGNQYYLADGFHRVMAARRNDWRDIDANVQIGTKADALWFALGANKANAHRMTTADKKHAIVLALQTWPERSMTQLAEQIGCALSYFKTIKDQVFATEDLPDRVTGKDGKSYPASRPKPVGEHVVHPKLPRSKRAFVLASVHAIAKALKASNRLVTQVRKAAGLEFVDKSRVAVAQRRKDIADMAARGYSTPQIADALGIKKEATADIARKHGIVIHADRVTGGTRRHDPNRIIDQIAIAAENVTAGSELIDFGNIDRQRLPEWIESLTLARQALSVFIRQLQQENKRHEAA